MRITLSILCLSSILFASGEFKQNKEYTCLNTMIIEDGKKTEVDFLKSFERPFIFTLEKKKIVSTNNVVFNFEKKEAEIEKFSNEKFILSLLKHKELSLTPKSSNGQVEYIFKCRTK